MRDEQCNKSLRNERFEILQPGIVYYAESDWINYIIYAPLWLQTFQLYLVEDVNNIGIIDQLS